MKRINITYNDNSFTQSPSIKNIFLEGTFVYPSNFIIKSGETTTSFNSRDNLISLFEKTKGLNPNELQLYLLKNGFENWENSSFYEIQALKSILLCFHWMDLSISNEEDLDINKVLYNEFIIDWNYQINPQNSIYLLQKKYTQEEKYIHKLNKLLEINLLCKITITTEKQCFNNYFIPLLTPGVNVDYYKNKSDLNGIETNNLWRLLLKEKSIRINYWLKNRF
jgi:hypothetical protein